MGEQNLDRLSAMRAFAMVGRRLSFVNAAAALDISASALSRRIAQLENALGCRLLHRTTRSVTLMEAGEIYLDRCLDVLACAEEADAAVSAHAVEPHGLLRIALPNLYGQKVVAPLLPRFMERHPRLKLQLLFDDRFADLVETRVDVGVRIGTLTSGDYVVRKLTMNRRNLCASPAYLERRGAPTAIDDLGAHDCLHFSPLMDGASWRLVRDGRAADVTIDPLLQADNAEALRLAALGGRGIALLADFLVEPDLAEGRLVRVLPEWQVADSTVYAVYPHGRHVPAKTRAFVDFVAAEIGT
ncbi:LysR family transcriptional regulator [Chenggangzhangella methanolivorans]|uniref:LysR family transcriptional regulator n=1 Tax=Chenggangzhangella methanolivorans TaxID=1437009 RepID=UPI00360EB8FB